jgi:lysozyme family protein
MVATNLNTAAAFTFTQEGDETVSLDPNDGGNWSGGSPGDGSLIGTKYGVSAPALIAWLRPDPVTAQTMAALDAATADAIYRARYWSAAGGDVLPPGVDLSTADHQFNAGTWGARLTQRVAGVTVDGWIGPETAAAVAKGGTLTQLGKLSVSAAAHVQTYLGVVADGDVGPITIAAAQARADRTFIFCAALADSQLAYYQSLAGWGDYGHGWTARVWARLDAALKLCPQPAVGA